MKSRPMLEATAKLEAPIHAGEPTSAGLGRVWERRRRRAAVDVDQHQIHIQRTVAGGEHRDGAAVGCEPRTRVKPGSAGVHQPVLAGVERQAPEVEVDAASAV